MPGNRRQRDRSHAVMEIRQLKHFVALYERKHYGRAATYLELSQSALTKSIRKLESSLGVKLFERGRYGAEPTTYGDALLHHAKTILAEQNLAAEELQSLRESGHGTVRIGIGFSCAHRLLPDAIGRLNESHPGITVIAQTGASAELLELLLQGKFDFVLSSPPPTYVHDPEVNAEKLYRDRDLIVASRDNPLAGKRNVSLQDLANSHWTISYTYKEMMLYIQKVFSANGISGPKITVKTDSLALTMGLIARSGYISLLSEDFLGRSENLEGLVRIRNSAFERPRIGSLFSRRRFRMSNPGSVLADHIRDICVSKFGEMTD